MTTRFVVGGCAEVTRGSAFDKGDYLVVDSVDPSTAAGGPIARVLVFAKGMKAKAQELAGFLGTSSSRAANTRSIDALKLLSHTSLSMTGKEADKATRFADEMGKIMFKPPTEPAGPNLVGIKLKNVPLILGVSVQFCDAATVMSHKEGDMWRVRGDDGVEGVASEATIKRCKAPAGGALDADGAWEDRPVQLTGDGTKVATLLKTFPESKAAPEGHVDPMELMAVLNKFEACKPMVAMAKESTALFVRNALLLSGVNVLLKLLGERPFPTSTSATSPAVLGSELVRLVSSEPEDKEVEIVKFPRATALKELASSVAEWKKAEKRIVSTITRDDADEIMKEQLFIDKHIENYLAGFTIAHVAGMAEKSSLKYAEIVGVFYDLQYESSAKEKAAAKPDEKVLAGALAMALKDMGAGSKRQYEGGLTASDNAHLSKLKQAAVNIFNDKETAKRIFAMQTLADAGQLDSMNKLLDAEHSVDIKLMLQSVIDNPEKHLVPILEPEQFTAVHAVRNAVQLSLERELYGERRVPDNVSKQLGKIISRKLTKVKLLELIDKLQSGGASEPLAAFAKLGEEASLTSFISAMNVLQDGFFFITPAQSHDIRMTIREITTFVTKYRNLGASWTILSPWLFQVFSRIEKASSSHATPTAPLSWDKEHVTGMTEYREDFMNAFNLEMQSRKQRASETGVSKKRPLDKTDGNQTDGQAEKRNKEPKDKKLWRQAVTKLRQDCDKVDDKVACGHYHIRGECAYGKECRQHHKGRPATYKQLYTAGFVQGNGN